MPSFAIIIPARFGSTRFPGKPLTGLRGADGQTKSLIQRSWETASAACEANRIWVATDDHRIADHVGSFGGQVLMTPAACRNGTERCASALDQVGDDADFIVNMQGDAPLTPPCLVERLCRVLAEDRSAAMATPALRCSGSMRAHLIGDAAAGRIGGTTVAFDRSGRALYFSRRIIPFLPDPLAAGANIHLHLGLYAYRRKSLLEYAAAPPSTLEEAEGLEQLRFLDEGHVVRAVQTEPVGWDCIEVNNPGDVPAVESVLRARGIS